MGEAVIEVEAGAKAKVERAGDVELLVFSLPSWCGLSVTAARAGGSVVGMKVRGERHSSKTATDDAVAVHQPRTTASILGYPDPRFNTANKVDYRLTHLLKAYGKEDPPPKRVKPVPVRIVHQAFDIAQSHGDSRSLTTADLMWIGFFFLGWPGEYTAASDESTPFRACDVTLFHDATPCLYESATDAAIDAAKLCHQ